MADNLVFEESVQSVVDTQDFISKKWVYVNDNNAQNYSSQVVIDSTPLSNAGGWINWSEGYIMMPMVVQLSANPTIAQGQTFAGLSASQLGDNSWAFKNGFWHIINSMTIEFNNQNVVQQTPFTNVFRSFKAMTSFSLDDVKNHGSSIGFAPDGAGSWSFRSANAPDGRGICNNRTAPYLVSKTTISTTAGGTLPAQTPVYSYLGNASAGIVNANGTFGGDENPSTYAYGEWSYNTGFVKRADYTGYDPVGVTDSLNQKAVCNVNDCGVLYRSSLVSATATALTWNVYAKLRLKDLHDYFEKMPLLKGSTIRFYLNTNQTKIDFTISPPQVDATGLITSGGNLVVDNVNINGGLSCPIMVASHDIAQGASSLPLVVTTQGSVLNATQYSLSCSIVTNTFTGNGQTSASTALRSCRLYAPVYKFTPLKEQQYLSLAPTKKIKYCDIFQYQFNGVEAGKSFNFLVSNGISNIKSVLVIPFIKASANGTSYDTPASPTSSSGATPDPIPLTQFNILVSGVNLFLNNEQYDYEAFCQELAQSNQLNGGLTTGLASGLISQDDFSRGMRYYYGNCSRILPAEAGVSRSVQIVGINQSQLDCNLMVFVEFEREMTIDLTTGARIA